jgi:hypothetical protein
LHCSCYMSLPLYSSILESRFIILQIHFKKKNLEQCQFVYAHNIYLYLHLPRHLKLVLLYCKFILKYFRTMSICACSCYMPLPSSSSVLKTRFIILQIHIKNIRTMSICVCSYYMPLPSSAITE